MRSTRRARAFTMIELIVVIVILGILAGVAIVGYGAVTSKAKDASVRQAALSFDREYRSLLGFATPNETKAQTIELAETDLPATVTFAYWTVTTIEGTATTATANTTRVSFSKDGSSVCLTLPLSSTAAASVPTSAACA